MNTKKLAYHIFQFKTSLLHSPNIFKDTLFYLQLIEHFETLILLNYFFSRIENELSCFYKLVSSPICIPGKRSLYCSLFLYKTSDHLLRRTISHHLTTVSISHPVFSLITRSLNMSLLSVIVFYVWHFQGS